MPDSLQIVKRLFPDVERVKNASKDITIEVMKSDVQKGQTKNHKECVMANACKRALKLDGAVVSVGTVYLIKDDVATRYRVPQSLSREIVSFDRGGSFAPGQYDLRQPEPTAPRGSGTRHKGNPRMGNKAPHHVTAGIRTSLLALGQ